MNDAERGGAQGDSDRFVHVMGQAVIALWSELCIWAIIVSVTRCCVNSWRNFSTITTAEHPQPITSYAKSLVFLTSVVTALACGLGYRLSSAGLRCRRRNTSGRSRRGQDRRLLGGSLRVMACIDAVEYGSQPEHERKRHGPAPHCLPHAHTGWSLGRRIIA